MIEINGLNERIANLKMQYQEAERINLKNKADELLVDINYLEELRELRNKQEPFINKSCISEKVCEHDKQKVLDKIRAEIEKIIQKETVIDSSGGEYERTISKLDPDDVFEIIDKYKEESEVKANENEK